MVDRDIDVLTDGLTMQTVAVIFDKNRKNPMVLYNCPQWLKAYFDFLS